MIHDGRALPRYQTPTHRHRAWSNPNALQHKHDADVDAPFELNPATKTPPRRRKSASAPPFPSSRITWGSSNFTILGILLFIVSPRQNHTLREKPGCSVIGTSTLSLLPGAVQLWQCGHSMGRFHGSGHLIVSRWRDGLIDQMGRVMKGKGRVYYSRALLLLCCACAFDPFEVRGVQGNGVPSGNVSCSELGAEALLTEPAWLHLSGYVSTSC